MYIYNIYYATESQNVKIRFHSSPLHSRPLFHNSIAELATNDLLIAVILCAYKTLCRDKHKCNGRA